MLVALEDLGILVDARKATTIDVEKFVGATGRTFVDLRRAARRWIGGRGKPPPGGRQHRLHSHAHVKFLELN
jgi:hypothetical protein